MKEATNQNAATGNTTDFKPAYVTPEVRIMTEAEVLSAFQVTAAASTAGWWAC